MKCTAALVALALPLVAQRLEPVQADFETVWNRYLELADDAEGRNGFLADVLAEGRSEVLESIVMSGEHGPIEALRLLVEADDPRWVRAAAWALERRDSHLQNAGTMHLESAGEAVDAWLVVHAETLGPKGKHLASLRPPAEELGAPDPRHLAPFGRAAILTPLEPGWTHNRPVTLRALDAFALLDVHEPHRIERVLGLVRHEDALLARRAALAFTYLRAREVPSEALLVVVEDPDAEPELRAAALAGASHGPHTVAWLALVDVASRPVHPAWRVAVDRLADVDLGFAATHLRTIELRLDAGAHAHLEGALARIDARLAMREAELPLRELLERAAWADLVCSPLEDALGSWTFARVQGWLERPDVRPRLEALRDSYEPAEGLDGRSVFGNLRTRVRSYAERTLAPR